MDFDTTLINGRLPHFNEMLDRKLQKGVNFIKSELTIARRCKDYKFLHSRKTGHYLIAYCSSSRKEIVFNSQDLELMPWSELIETLLHEVAHIRHANHLREWRSHFNNLIILLENKFPGWPEPVSEATSEVTQAAHGEMANTGDLKSPEVTPLVGSSPTARTIVEINKRGN